MNKMLPVLLLIVVVGAGTIMTLVFRSSEPLSPSDAGMLQDSNETPALPTTDTEMAEVTDDTADRDDYVETVKTLSAQLNAVKNDNKSLEKTVSSLTDTLDRRLDERIAQHIDAARNDIIDNVEKTLNGNLNDWKNQLSSLKTTIRSGGGTKQKEIEDQQSAGQLDSDHRLSGASSAGIPPGFGYDYPVNTANSGNANIISIGGKRYVRLQPLSSVVTKGDGIDGMLSPLSKLSPLSTTTSNSASLNTKTRTTATRKAQDKSAIEKRYTIPDTATLVNSTSMTAMLGRVPFKGKVVSPFRFKVITGPDNLATNGHRIPGIKNIVWSGYAQGVREQECVRGFLDTVTYTFKDGTISTYSVKRRQQNSNNNTSQQYIAYISDPWGKPCIRGVLYSNASQYLRDRIIVATAAAASRSAASSRTTTTQSASNNSISSFVSGDKTQFIAADAFAGGLDEATEYLRDIMNDAFDVVYVQTGQPLTINVEREIPIDYNPDGRKLSHEFTTHKTPSRLD